MGPLQEIFYEVIPIMSVVYNLAGLITLLSKPTGFRLKLLAIGVLSYVILSALHLMGIYSDNNFILNFIAQLAWVWAGVLTVLSFNKKSNNQADTGRSGIKEALTVIPVQADNPIDTINEARQAIYDKLEAIVKEQNLSENTNVQLLQSQNYANDCFVSLSMFHPSSADKNLASKLGFQSVIFITLHSTPFMRFPFIYSIRIESSNKQKQFTDVFELDFAKIEQLIEKLVLGNTWRFRPNRLRIAPLQFWRPANKIVDYNETNFYGKLVLFFPPLLIFSLLRWIFFGPKNTLKLTTGKPAAEPRNLLPLDSWQVAIKGMQSYANQLEKEFIDEMQSSSSEFGQLSEENIWYWGVDGKVERKQQVFRIGRALVFIKVYGYGQDLYIGWDAHVNAGSWGEKKIGGGFAKDSGTALTAFEVESQWHQPNEYDIGDANFALETVHATLVKLTKRLVKERDIDQDIDFTIVRESRADVLKKENNIDGAEKKKRFMRKK